MLLANRWHTITRPIVADRVLAGGRWSYACFVGQKCHALKEMGSREQRLKAWMGVAVALQIGLFKVQRAMFHVWASPCFCDRGGPLLIVAIAAAGKVGVADGVLDDRLRQCVVSDSLM